MTSASGLQICLFDPGLERHNGEVSNNLGDLVIQEAVLRELRGLFPASTIHQLATHQYLGLEELKLARSCQLRIVGGSNLLSSHQRGNQRQWLVKLRQVPWLRGVVLMGPGWQGYQSSPDFYSRIFFQLILAKRPLHAVRSDYAKQQLQAAGIRNTITTLCPSLWSMWGVQPSEFPTSKSDCALVTLTDFRADPLLDRQWLELILRQYREVFFWPQGKYDHEIHDVVHHPRIRILERSFPAIQEFVKNHKGFDYVGTRLHGGILCLQSRRRSLILEVDNRATEMAKSAKLPVCRREDVGAIERWITQASETRLSINLEPIERWRSVLRKFVCNRLGAIEIH